MKIIPIILTFFLVFESCSKEKTDLKTEKENTVPAEKPTVTNDSISILSKEDVQKYYAEFENDLQNKALDSTSLDYECDGKDGRVIYYSKNNELKIIKHEYSEYSHYSAVEKFYMNKEKPFFIFRDESVWSFDGGTLEKPETKDNITESRMYFVNGKMIDCLEKKYILKSADNEKPDPSKFPNQKSKDCKSEEMLSELATFIKHKNDKTDLKTCL
ncbi:hypothetical protein [Chryseobacterium caseinilyticum]|uniref:Lipoprotein n=1 Tax=Chryseobacterium caseinilyticum TaxID=2771428 RepID=A0ABR8Z7T2_9FLAO|nr:hypothetical protein [Chryseobacterium caseinilyticum]MBD8081347.1 hypothetical protein [Chryseobacterium caseinilyticum]